MLSKIFHKSKPINPRHPSYISNTKKYIELNGYSLYGITNSILIKEIQINTIMKPYDQTLSYREKKRWRRELEGKGFFDLNSVYKKLKKKNQ